MMSVRIQVDVSVYDDGGDDGDDLISAISLYDGL